MLTKARLLNLDPNDSISSGTRELHQTLTKKRFMNSKWRYCPCINRRGKITFNSNGHTNTMPENMDCTSNNSVYCISCKKYEKQYVGHTMNTVKQRFQGHFYLVKHKKEDHEVSRHFNTGAPHFWMTKVSPLSAFFITIVLAVAKSERCLHPKQVILGLHSWKFTINLVP